MWEDHPSGDNSVRQRSPLATYLIATFVLSWVVGIGFAIVLTPLERVLGIPEGMLSNLPAKYGPTLGGLVTAYLVYGSAGFQSLFRRGLRFRGDLLSWFFALAFPLGTVVFLFLFFSDQALEGRLSGAVLGMALVSLARYLFLGGGFGEEYGWRGFMLPELVRRFSPLTASLLIAPVWVAWHLPAYALSPKGQEDPLGPFTVFVFAASIVLTWLYYRARESVLVVAVFHAAINASGEISRSLFGYDQDALMLPDPYRHWGLPVVTLVVALILVGIHGRGLGRRLPDGNR